MKPEIAIQLLQIAKELSVPPRDSHSIAEFDKAVDSTIKNYQKLMASDTDQPDGTTPSTSRD